MFRLVSLTQNQYSCQLSCVSRKWYNRLERKEELPKMRFGDGYNPAHVERIKQLSQRF
jgi:hypothetical protein